MRIILFSWIPNQIIIKNINFQIYKIFYLYYKKNIIINILKIIFLLISNNIIIQYIGNKIYIYFKI
jgi:hypothetical protein